ncbi:hypothetical protein [Pyxidicoccus sp. MSG2]|uniref:hypothetical protein n=1 Tax=Pyxidicoccus sp. MSG2 TaxID=2996790 RepID=UPI00226DE558|nr:hypothetical protein [Pyxidicoccus sp. MSG2]MCY1021354.1 hypothetical protein [Pyxidicoccus sp. MSG2]
MLRDKIGRIVEMARIAKPEVKRFLKAKKEILLEELKRNTLGEVTRIEKSKKILDIYLPSERERAVGLEGEPDPGGA